MILNILGSRNFNMLFIYTKTIQIREKGIEYWLIIFFYFWEYVYQLK